jgi:hypothetical protein
VDPAPELDAEYFTAPQMVLPFTSVMAFPLSWKLTAPAGAACVVARLTWDVKVTGTFTVEFGTLEIIDIGALAELTCWATVPLFPEKLESLP